MRGKFFLLIISFFVISKFSFGQDQGYDIKSIVQADGTMYYYVAMEHFILIKQNN